MKKIFLALLLTNCSTTPPCTMNPTPTRALYRVCQTPLPQQAPAAAEARYGDSQSVLGLWVYTSLPQPAQAQLEAIQALQQAVLVAHSSTTTTTSLRLQQQAAYQ